MRLALLLLLLACEPVDLAKRKAACQRACHPAQGERIREHCHCATPTGWERKPVKESDVP